VSPSPSPDRTEAEIQAGIAAIRELQDTRLPKSLRLTEASCRAIVVAVLSRSRELAHRGEEEAR
jgi:hypothetical protein